MKEPILILHGWSTSMGNASEKYGKLKSILEKRGYQVFTPDMPGFGNNQLKKDELYFDDYVDFVKSYIEKNKLKQVILIGHSFGGRVAIAFAVQYPKYISKLILAAASGIPHPLPSLKKKLVYFITKITKPVFSFPPGSWFYNALRKVTYYALGEMDYYKAGKLSKTFKNVYQKSVLGELKQITVSTLILWGARDIFVPVSDAIIMSKEIPGATLDIQTNEGHKFPYEHPGLFAEEVLKFIA